MKERLSFAKEVYDGLVFARFVAQEKEICGLEKAIKVLTEKVLEMGRDDEENSGKTCASTGEISSSQRA
ncbi:hypothetical protein [Negativicoccus succinicivorans]